MRRTLGSALWSTGHLMQRIALLIFVLGIVVFIAMAAGAAGVGGLLIFVAIVAWLVRDGRRST